VITQEDWTPERAQVLRTPSGLVFATMTHADVISLATHDGARLETRLYGLLLHSTARPRDLPLFIRNDDLVFAGVLRAGRATGLRWTPADGPRMRVAPPRDPRVRFVGSPAVEVACADLALVPGATGTASPEHTLRGPGPIAVAASPGGPAVVHLRPGRTGDVTLLERDGRHVKIAWLIADQALADATVIGWVDGARIGDLSPASGGSMHAGHMSGLKGTSDWGGCQAEHPLLADAGRGPELVGTILVGTRVRRGPRRGALVEVEVEGPSVQQVPPVLKLRSGAKFLLAPPDAIECAG
jgi:hypothetical protein